MVDKEIQTMGNFVGGLLESLPLRDRGQAIREIQKLEEKYYNNLEKHRGDNPKLSLQLLRIEQIKMVPRLNVEPIRRWSNVPQNYGQAVVNFLTCLPLSYRVQALKKISDIASTFAIDSHNPKTRS